MRLHFTAIAILSALLFYLLNSATEQEAGTLSGSVLALTRDYDYFMTGLENTHFGADGRPRYSLRADRLTHYPDPEYTLVEAPYVVMYQEEEPPWHISARQGRVEPDPEALGDRVELSGDVVIHRVDSREREWNIYTEFLTVYPDAKTFHTNRQVTIETREGRLESMGMEGDLNSNRIELLDDVRGNYEKDTRSE